MKITGVIILFFVISNVYSQNLSLDYKNVGEVNYHKTITLSHQYDGVNGSPMVSIYLWNLQTNKIKLLLTEKWASDNWHYHTFKVTKWKTGSYKFIVGFGKHISREISFFVWNRK
jgi:hypothetical protein